MAADFPDHVYARRGGKGGSMPAFWEGLCGPPLALAHSPCLSGQGAFPLANQSQRPEVLLGC